MVFVEYFICMIVFFVYLLGIIMHCDETHMYLSIFLSILPELPLRVLLAGAQSVPDKSVKREKVRKIKVWVK